MKVREVIRLLGREGWVLVVTKGSHRQFYATVEVAA
jgi:predicted RNA binding protein YcfA (HicA-like mRNA interferase family)